MPTMPLSSACEAEDRGGESQIPNLRTHESWDRAHAIATTQISGLLLGSGLNPSDREAKGYSSSNDPELLPLSTRAKLAKAVRNVIRRPSCWIGGLGTD